MEIIPKEDCLDDICKGCGAHENCDLSTYRIDTFWDIEDMIRGCFECDCNKGDVKNMGLDNDCPRCGAVIQEIGNGMIGKCDKCGFIQCPSCGQEAIEGFCMNCILHIDERGHGIHSVGMCSNCNLEIFEKIRNTNQYERDVSTWKI